MDISAEPLSDDPVRRDLRRLHEMCDRTIGDLEEGVVEEVRREQLLTAVAAVVYVVGTIAVGAGHGQHAGRGGSQPCTTGLDGVSREGLDCLSQPLPSHSHGEGGPIDQRVDEAYLSAGDQIRAIHDGVDAIDELVISSPDPSTWTADEASKWEQLSTALAAACGT